MMTNITVYWGNNRWSEGGKKTSAFMIDALFEPTLHLSPTVCELRASAASSKGHMTGNSLNLKWRKKVSPSPWWLSLPLSPATLSLLPVAALPAPTTRTHWLSSSTFKLQVGGGRKPPSKKCQNKVVLEDSEMSRTWRDKVTFFSLNVASYNSGICPRGSQRQFYLHIFLWNTTSMYILPPLKHIPVIPSSEYRKWGHFF